VPNNFDPMTIHRNIWASIWDSKSISKPLNFTEFFLLRLACSVSLWLHLFIRVCVGRHCIRTGPLKLNIGPLNVEATYSQSAAACSRERHIC